MKNKAPVKKVWQAVRPYLPLLLLAVLFAPVSVSLT